MAHDPDLEQLIHQHPQAQGQLLQHWLCAAGVLLGLVASSLALQQGRIPVLWTSQETMPPLVLLIAMGVHGLGCLIALFWNLGSPQRLRQIQANDQERLEQVLAYLRQRRWWLLAMALCGQGLLILAGLYDKNLSSAPWLLLALVPSFLCISLSLRQPPSTQRIAAHVRRLRLIQQPELSSKPLG